MQSARWELPSLTRPAGLKPFNPCSPLPPLLSQADIVVLATGYRPTARSLFPPELQEAAGFKGDDQWLYRWGGCVFV